MHKETEASKNHEVSDYDYIMSAFGNGYFSGLSLEQLWNCIRLSTNREELDVAISASIELKELMENINERKA